MVMECFGGEGNTRDTSDELHFECLPLLFLFSGGFLCAGGIDGCNQENVVYFNHLVSEYYIFKKKSKLFIFSVRPRIK